MSKKAEARERQQRQTLRTRLVVGLAVVGAAGMVALLLIYPSLTPIGEVATPPAVERALADGRSLGDPQAPVVIEVYEDFQCSACAVFAEQLEPRLVTAFVETGQARLVFRHFAFLGPESLRAAEASWCAEEQERFWDYHDILFANQAAENRGAFADRRLLAYAETLGLDTAAFETCFSERRYRDAVMAERDTGVQLGVNSTPTIVVNGQIVQGASERLVPTFEHIAAAVEAALAASP